MNKELSLNEKLDLILKNQKKIMRNENKILKIEDSIKKIDNKELDEELIQIKEEELTLKEISEIEKKISKKNKLMYKITKKDLIKGFVGAFFGIIAHFSFAKGIIIAKNLNLFNSTILFISAFIILNIILYYTGFRNVKKHLIMKFMPLRAITIYLVSIFTIIFVLLLFNEIRFPINFYHLYNLIGANIILAVLGAGTADLIGKN